MVEINFHVHENIISCTRKLIFTDMIFLLMLIFLKAYILICYTFMFNQQSIYFILLCFYKHFTPKMRMLQMIYTNRESYVLLSDLV